MRVHFHIFFEIGDIDVSIQLSHIDTYSIITELKMNSKLWCFDLGIYGYLDQRIDLSSFKLLENPLISFGMVFETYPVFWILLGLMIVMWMLLKGINWAFLFLDDQP